MTDHVAEKVRTRGVIIRGVLWGAGGLIVATAFGLLMARVDGNDERQEVCQRFRSELIKHGVAVYGDDVPPDVRRRWETMC